MCGRFVIKSAPDEIREFFDFTERPNFPPRYNVAPTQPIPLVRLDRGARRLALARWGLIPSWVKDPKQFSLLINARAEGIAEKAAYKAAIRRRRCLIPADGFYEWTDKKAGRCPYYVRRRDGAPMAFAGIAETWIDRDGGEIDTAAIITTTANALLMPVHDRMPVLIAREDFATWLEPPETEFERATALLKPAPEDLLEAYEVSPRVNKFENDDETNIAPVGADSPVA